MTREAGSRRFVEDVADASGLGLPAGIWPSRIRYCGRPYHYRRADVDVEGEALAVQYEDENGRRLVVLND